MKSPIIYRPKSYSFAGVNLTLATGTTATLLATPSTDDSICKSLLLTSTDTVARDVQLIVVKASSSYVISTVTVPAGAGTVGSTPPVDALTFEGLPLDSSGKKVIPLQGSTVLQVRAVATVSSGKTITAAASLEDF